MATPIWIRTARPGLGAHAYAEFGIPVIGVAKSRFRTATHAVPVVRGSSARALFVTAAGMPTADAANLVRRMAGPVPASRCIAPRRHPRAGRSARRHQNRPPPRLTYPDARGTRHVRMSGWGRGGGRAGGFRG